MSWIETETRLREFYGRPMRREVALLGERQADLQRDLPADTGFLTEVSGKLILTAPANTTLCDLPDDVRERAERASRSNPFYLWVQGRFVEAEKANGNGAFWSAGDLEFGSPSVTHGPLNWLHEARKVIGTIADNALVAPTAEQAAVGQRPHIVAVSAMWRWLYEPEAKAVEAAADNHKLFYSMECVSREVACIAEDGRPGCGESFGYGAYLRGEACEHINERASVRRFVDPSFLGGAVIVPPVQPGWGDARAELMRQAASLAESTAHVAETAGMTTTEWEQVAAGVIALGQA